MVIIAMKVNSANPVLVRKKKASLAGPPVSSPIVRQFSKDDSPLLVGQSVRFRNDILEVCIGCVIVGVARGLLSMSETDTVGQRRCKKILNCDSGAPGSTRRVWTNIGKFNENSPKRC